MKHKRIYEALIILAVCVIALLITVYAINKVNEEPEVIEEYITLYVGDNDTLYLHKTNVIVETRILEIVEFRAYVIRYELQYEYILNSADPIMIYRIRYKDDNNVMRWESAVKKSDIRDDIWVDS